MPLFIQVYLYLSNIPHHHPIFIEIRYSHHKTPFMNTGVIAIPIQPGNAAEDSEFILILIYKNNFLHGYGTFHRILLK